MLSLPDNLAAALFAALPRATIIVLGAGLLLWVTRRLARRLDTWARSQGHLAPTEGEKRLRTLGNILRYAASLLVIGGATAMLLREVGVDVVPLLAGASVLGLVFGLGAQNLVKDYVSGFFLLVENQYAVGDVIEVGSVSGRVERITLRVTELRDALGKSHFVPNGEIRVVSNLTKEWSRAVLDVAVGYGESVDRVMAELRAIGEEMAAHASWKPLLLEPLNVLGIQDLADSGVLIRVTFKTLPEKQWDVARELRRRIKNRFDQVGIEIPFPHRTLYLRSDSGAAQSPTGAGAPETKAED